MSKSSLLFHGPAAQATAAQKAAEWGRIVGTFGDPRVGFTAEVARETAAALLSPTVGDERGALVIGPMDLVSREGVQDALLKVLEEPDPDSPRAYLWAWDEGSVRPTIRSRCLSFWCPGVRALDGGIQRTARDLVRSSLAGEVSGVIEVFGEAAPSEADKWRHFGPQVLMAAASEMTETVDSPSKFRLWSALRKVAARREPSRNEVLEAFLP